MPANDEYQLELTNTARKELLALSNEAARRMQRGLNVLLAQYRQGEPAANVVAIAGRINTYRLRVGDYRAVFEVIEPAAIIRVLRIGHHRDIYRDV